MRFGLVMCRFLEFMCQGESVHNVQTRRKKDTYQICQYNGAMHLLSTPEVRIRCPQPMEIRQFVRIFVKSVGWLRSVTQKCLIGTASGTIETSRQEVTTEQDTPPSPSSTIKATIGRRHRTIERTHLLGCIGDDAGNGHSMLIWKIRCGRVAFAKAKVGEKMADGRNAGYMLTKIFRNSVSDPEPVGP